jgi:MFS family permease
MALISNGQRLLNARKRNAQQLIKVKQRSLAAIRLAIMADMMVGVMLMPNYPIMVDKGAHDDSFPSTYPFGFASATQFIPMTYYLGVSIASLCSGSISDRVGRKPVILFCIGGSIFGSVAKWWCRKSFLGFCTANFVNGLLSSGFPVILAYVSDLFESKEEKEKEFSTSVGCYVLGQGLGGIIAIILYPWGLFVPILAGIGLLVAVFVFNCLFLIEPKNLEIPLVVDMDNMSFHEVLEHSEEKDAERSKGEQEVNQETNQEEAIDESNDNKVKFLEQQNDIEELPDKIDKKIMTIIITGAFTDIVGSETLYPLCITPLAFNIFYRDFIVIGESPPLPLNGYQWLTILVPLLVIPSAIIGPTLFRKIGLASTCIMGNVLTGLLTIALLFVANIETPTSWTCAWFFVVLYICFPFTVLSMISVSPMLDRIAPIDKRGFMQGVYSFILNITSAISIWLLGLLADMTSTNTMIWTGIGISFGAAMVNTPLIFIHQLQPLRPSPAL